MQAIFGGMCAGNFVQHSPALEHSTSVARLRPWNTWNVWEQPVKMVIFQGCRGIYWRSGRRESGRFEGNWVVLDKQIMLTNHDQPQLAKDVHQKPTDKCFANVTGADLFKSQAWNLGWWEVGDHMKYWPRWLDVDVTYDTICHSEPGGEWWLSQFYKNYGDSRQSCFLDLRFF